MKIKQIVSVFIVLFVVVAAAQFSYAQCSACSQPKETSTVQSAVQGISEDLKVPNQETCPVMGKKINKEVFTDYKGKRVYFCCEGCIEKFKKSADEHMKKFEEESVVLADAPVTQENCPVSGNPVNTAFFTDLDGQRIYFCCGGCKAKFTADPKKYSVNL